MNLIEAFYTPAQEQLANGLATSDRPRRVYVIVGGVPRVGPLSMFSLEGLVLRQLSIVQQGLFPCLFFMRLRPRVVYDLVGTQSWVLFCRPFPIQALAVWSNGLL